MKLQVREAPPANYPWLCNRVGHPPTAHFRALEAFVPDGPILAMCGYDTWAKNSAAIHFALESPIAIRSLIRPAFDFPFNHCGLGVLFGTVRSDNERALKLDRHLGFKEVARLRDAAEPGVDIIVFEMRREDCRWLKGAS